MQKMNTSISVHKNDQNISSKRKTLIFLAMCSESLKKMYMRANPRIPIIFLTFKKSFEIGFRATVLSFMIGQNRLHWKKLLSSIHVLYK